jgi:serine protease AprX
LAVIVVVAGGSSPATPVDAAGHGRAKLDPLLQAKSAASGRSRVVLRVASKAALPDVVALARSYGGKVIRRLPIVDGVLLDLPNLALPMVAGHSQVTGVSADRAIVGAMERTGATIGATTVRQQLGYDGAGIGVAVIDSGVSGFHDDLADPATGAARVDRFVDFVNGRAAPYDDYGHGTHVAGIIAGNGADSGGARSGIAPRARLVVLKVLDEQGRGHISDVIAALNYVVANRDALSIRIVNLSVATGVYESYNSDPLTLAAKRAVEAGIVVVAAAGNNGRSPQGATQYGGITAPGNAPWVLTVGASSHMGTIDREDDTIAPFSSRGPAAIDNTAKPDLVAPGVGLESLSDPGSWLYATRSLYLLNGTKPTSHVPYLSLSGTSAATPVVAGTAALMLQANPSLTPNAIKAILQYTAQTYKGYDELTQGAGFVNAKGAVELAAYLSATAAAAAPDSRDWSRSIIWGNQVVKGGDLTAAATAWALGVTWGSASLPTGAPVSWGVKAKKAWRPEDGASANDDCGGQNCQSSGTTRLLFGVSDADGDTVVWGTADTDGDTVVWGTACLDRSCEPVVWTRR